MNELGQRRRAFRKREGECEFDFRGRKLMERQERQAILGGVVSWSPDLGPYCVAKHGRLRKRLTNTEKRAMRRETDGVT